MQQNSYKTKELQIKIMLLISSSSMYLGSQMRNIQNDVNSKVVTLYKLKKCVTNCRLNNMIQEAANSCW